jgi:hypothetical protein
MVVELVWYGVALLAVVTAVAAGSYIGTLRALETFHSGEDSVFLSGDARQQDPQEPTG